MGRGNIEARGGWQLSNHQDQSPMSSSPVIDLISTYTVYCNLKKELCRFVYYFQTSVATNNENGTNTNNE